MMANLGKWYAPRGLEYVWRRSVALLNRYGITTSKAIDRIETCLKTLADFDCSATFSTPGRVVQRYPTFIRSIQDKGAEIAVHGFDHVDLSILPPITASRQLVRAADIFSQNGIEVHGFRCPYLRCTDKLLELLPGKLFGYSSNSAIWWDVNFDIITGKETSIYTALQQIYKPKSAEDGVCLPSLDSNMVEIPVSIPDDLQLHDGLNLGPEEIGEVWRQILHRTHQRGEMYVLPFHPELGSQCQQPIMTVLREAGRMHPSVWVARLRDINTWWREKSNFSITLDHTSEGLDITFNCSDRATILTKGLDIDGLESLWDEQYYLLDTKELHVPEGLYPFIGVPVNTPEHIISFLQEQGYILLKGDLATRCATYLDAATLTELTSQVELVNYIEISPGPMVRYWRWPEGTKSALCLTGDLDALTLFDYVYRLFVF